MNKLEVFKPYLKMIKSEKIRAFTEYCILKFPDYFWEIMASTSEMGHGKGETLLEHISGCLYVAMNLINGHLKDHLNDKQKDQLLSAIMLHDGWRCHNADGSKCTFTKKDVEKYNLPSKKIGQWKTSKEHPEAGYKNLLKLSLSFNNQRDADKKDRIGSRELDQILLAVRRHYGPFTVGSEVDFSWSWPCDNISILLVMIDANQSINSGWWTTKYDQEKERIANCLNEGKEVNSDYFQKSYCKDAIIARYDEKNCLGLISIDNRYISFSQWDYIGKNKRDVPQVNEEVIALFNALGQLIKVKAK